MNERGDGPAFDRVHSVGGEAINFRHLSRLLGPEQRFYGITLGWRNAQFASSIESMVRRYVDALVAFQPEGPYLLGGWSAGSTIAPRRSRCKRAAGTCRCWPPWTGRRAARRRRPARGPVDFGKLLCNLPYWVIDDLMLDFSFSAFAHRIWNKFASIYRKSTAFLRGRSDWRRFEVDGFMDTSAFSDDQAGFMRALYHLLHVYVPKPYSGRVILYKATTQPLHHLFEVEGPWREIAAETGRRARPRHAHQHRAGTVRANDRGGLARPPVQALGGGGCVMRQ